VDVVELVLGAAAGVEVVVELDADVLDELLEDELLEEEPPVFDFLSRESLR
jgi:hypothetical protein